MIYIEVTRRPSDRESVRSPVLLANAAEAFGVDPQLLCCTFTARLARVRAEWAPIVAFVGAGLRACETYDGPDDECVHVISSLKRTVGVCDASSIR